jgi:hypothetical protein
MANDEGSDEEGCKGDGNGDEGGGLVTATMMEKRVRAARAMVTRVVGDEEGDGDGDKRTVAATDSKRHAVSDNGRRTAVATEKERAGAAAEPSLVFCLY